MPCYVPPPPWEGAQRKNAEQAARLLCQVVGGRVRAGDPTLPREFLLWFVEHRKIDRRIATTPSYGNVDPAEAAGATRDIELAGRLLNAFSSG